MCSCLADKASRYLLLHSTRKVRSHKSSCHITSRDLFYNPGDTSRSGVRLLSDQWQFADFTEQLENKCIHTSYAISGTISSMTFLRHALNPSQAVVLSSRPILLHLAKSAWNHVGQPTTESISAPLRRLARTCLGAAQNILKVLGVLRDHEMLCKCLATSLTFFSLLVFVFFSFSRKVNQKEADLDMKAAFGFFDIESIFSAAFVMLLFKIVADVYDDAPDYHTGPTISDALSHLDYFADRGNKAGAERKAEILRVTSLLSSKMPDFGGLQSSSSEADMCMYTRYARSLRTRCAKAILFRPRRHTERPRSRFC